MLADRDRAWTADVAHRLAARPTVAENSYGLIHGLVERSGCAVPATDGYVLAWTRQITDSRLLERLREDPHTPVLVPHALAMAETPDRLTWSVGPEAPTHWPTALATLVTEGVLDRAQVVDLCVSRLLRGGRARDLRFPLDVLRLVEPNAAERRERVPDWIGMTADAPSPVAGYAQEVLAGLAAEGALATGALVEMTGGVLFRTEKKLVRAQLTLVGKVLAREPGVADELLPAVAEAFGHEDTTIQERALKLVGRHVAAVDASVRGELAEQAGLLSPVHRPTAVELFGEALEVESGTPYEEILPPVPEREAVAPCGDDGRGPGGGAADEGAVPGPVRVRADARRSGAARAAGPGGAGSGGAGSVPDGALAAPALLHPRHPWGGGGTRGAARAAAGVARRLRPGEGERPECLSPRGAVGDPERARLWEASRPGGHGRCRSCSPHRPCTPARSPR